MLPSQKHQIFQVRPENKVMTIQYHEQNILFKTEPRHYNGQHVFYQLFDVLCHNIKSNKNIKMAVVYNNSALQFIVIITTNGNIVASISINPFLVFYKGWRCWHCPVLFFLDFRRKMMCPA